MKMLKDKIEKILTELLELEERQEKLARTLPKELNIEKTLTAIMKIIETEKNYCQCEKKSVRLITHCRNCGKEIKNPPTIEEMLEENGDDESIELRFTFDEYSKIRGINIPIKLFYILTTL